MTNIKRFWYARKILAVLILFLRRKILEVEIHPKHIAPEDIILFYQEQEKTLKFPFNGAA